MRPRGGDLKGRLNFEGNNFSLPGLTLTLALVEMVEIEEEMGMNLR